jgi:putative heme-binding domain-containing protein
MNPALLSGFRSPLSGLPSLLRFFAVLLPIATIADDDPVSELASFQIADGFEVNLFASEEDGIIKPIQMRWDERGRLWVIGSVTYPQVKPTEEPNDKVWILEDTDGDGKSDKTLVFADGLMIPTGLEIAPQESGRTSGQPSLTPDSQSLAPSTVRSSAAYVGEGTKLWLMTDDDGDGRADRREIVLRGFGTGDNHQNLNSFRWSPGGELMFCQGLHAFSRVETPHGIVKLDEAGLWRFRPREQRLDAFYGGAADPQNPWGWVWTKWGQPIVVAGNNGTMYYPMPEMIRGWQNGRRDSIWEGKGRKTSGPEIIESQYFPEEWQGAMIAGGYINNAVWTLKIKDDGSGFRVVDHPALPPLITSTSGAFRPVDVKFGPDGALYICDWYNPIIGHYQASFRHPDRDKQHGRIWRIRWKNSPNSPGRIVVNGEVPKQIREATRKRSSQEIAEHEASGLRASLELATRSRDRFNREQILHVLRSRETSKVSSAVRDWIGRRDPALPDHDYALFLGLSVLESHDAVDVPVLKQALTAKTPDLRAYAAAVLARWADRLPIDFPTVETLADLAHDENSRVRLAAVVAAGNIPRPESIIVVLSAAEQARDKFIDTALRAAVAVLKPQWEPLLSKGIPDWKPRWRDLLAELTGTPAKQEQPAKPKASPVVAVVATGQLKATPEFVSALVEEVRAKGDAKRGAEVYRRAELICTTCHKIGDQGGIIGPALDSIGSAQPLDFIIGAVLEPQREIKESFETYAFALKDGHMLTGNIVAGTADRLTLRDPAGAEHSVAGTDVKEKKMIGSLMPAGLVDRLTREELRDLFAYLGGLGKAK